MADWKLTVRSGPKVRRTEFDQLEEALSELQRQAEEIKAQGPLRPRSMLRDFAPGEQVAARLEISGRGWLRAPTAGLDVMGDGNIVPFSGGMRREELQLRGRGSALDAVREALQR